MSRFRALSLCATFLCAVSLSAQTTGSLTGHLRDQSGAALPGVTVEVRSSSLQGTRVTTSDNQGAYRFSVLPPGEYAAAFGLSGFARETKKNLVINLAKESTLDVTLRASAAEQIEVTAEAPLLDTRSNDVGTSITKRQIENLPTGRNYSSIAQITPGVSSDANPENKGQSSITVYGSAGNENGYYIDGLNTTGVEYGFQGKELNFEFVQEVDVKTGGYEAEYGRSTGGIISVITKSGGNDYHGDLFGYTDRDSLQANPKEIVSTGGTTEGFTKDDYGVDVGGFIVKDRLWFFGAYDRVKNTINNSLPAGPRAGDIVGSRSQRSLGAFKLTMALPHDQTLVGSFFQDPRSDTPLAAMQAQFALLRRSSDALERATGALQGIEEQQAFRKVGSAGTPKALKRMEDLELAHGDFELVAGHLASLVGDLEASDGPPTGPQTALCDESIAELEKAAVRWEALKPPSPRK